MVSGYGIGMYRWKSVYGRCVRGGGEGSTKRR